MSTNSVGVVDLGLTGKVAVVTGGGSNIGRSLVRTLAGEGASVVVVDIDVPAGRSVAEAATADFGVDCTFVELDVTARSDVMRAADDVERRRGAVDIVVHVAGGPRGNGTFFERDLPSRRTTSS